YARHISKLAPGRSFTYRDACRTLFGALSDAGSAPREPSRVYPALGEFLFRLRRRNWLDFGSAGTYINGPITIGPAHPNAPKPTEDELAS
ncbi:MAG: hypothetical protein JWP32_2668, partial [Schumannella sp.]|nr:hypothetical protein [Schumannella sp.]